MPVQQRLTPHLARLEAEAIGNLREGAAAFRQPVLLYSIGKDSSVLLHLALKAFFPGKPPFPLLHIDTTWKFKEMIRFRDGIAERLGLEMLVHTNQEGLVRGINPIASGSALHTQVMKTEALIFSFRGPGHAWDPRAQRPELWSLFNTRIHQGESMRIFPLSNWTEYDVWDYIAAQDIPVVPLYFAALRPVVRRSGTWIMVDDNRLPLEQGETPETRMVRFRTLGCYPLSGAVESAATTLPDIIAEMRAARSSEREGRLIDNDTDASMERKKREGYF